MARLSPICMPVLFVIAACGLAAGAAGAGAPASAGGVLAFASNRAGDPRSTS